MAEMAAGRMEGTDIRTLGTAEIGRLGESIARSYLERRGWEVFEQNWRCRYGEADLIVRDPCEEGRVDVLVEVKTRRGGSDVAPELAVDQEKLERYRRIALAYLAGHLDVDSVRLDVIAITLDDDRKAHLRHLARAASWDY